ncbi:cilia- and flagella-associated protein HOATZ-like [Ruditapes philippinarum]|uniref:cilia- and flagella-associated protein HOATZ-like n=1 Tax=Ruditapes philippinarum TaxID=129788 RepID=UPI00295BBB92|nr:cilia- and flagella-associated protein HOATZ-like [Ruditapes philippinarum]
MAVVVDLTKGETTTFYGSSAEDVSYATNFWQSIQLHPPMESRLVSSDIKQRLKIAPPSSQARHVSQSRQEDSSAVLQSFISRARTMEHLEEFSKIQKFAEAKAEDKSLMTKHREIRKKKEEISRHKGVKPMEKPVERLPKEDYIVDEENDIDVLKQLNEFEEEKIGNNDSDSD